MGKINKAESSHEDETGSPKVNSAETDNGAAIKPITKAIKIIKSDILAAGDLKSKVKRKTFFWFSQGCILVGAKKTLVLFFTGNLFLLGASFIILRGI